MEANMITLFRIAMVFVTVGLFEVNSIWLNAVATLMVVFVIYLDSLDGYVARKLKITSNFGALFDITGDRIVENVFWIYFSAIGMISFWVPMIVIARGFLTDTVRAVAFREGKTPFGKKTMMKSKITRFLVASRFSRAFYGGLKLTVFTLIGVLIFLNSAYDNQNWVMGGAMPLLVVIKNILVFVTVFMCVVRGMPVLWDGKEILFSKSYPRTMDIIDQNINHGS